MPMNAVDITLYGIVDPARCAGRPADMVAQHAMAGGASAIQYRDKTSSTRAMVEHARDLKAALWGSPVPLIINDRVDVAQAVDAEGVHLGQDDMHPEDARAILGDHAMIGMSVKTPEDAGTAPLACVDYVFIGGVFDTASKDNPASIGVDGWTELAAIIRARKPGLPVGAIAGINESNVAGVIAAGADGVAVISAICMAQDVEDEARCLRQLIDYERRSRP
jgi:thiamine-phosphate pyrophosphorylase